MKVEDYKNRLKELGVKEEYIEYPAITGGLLKKAVDEQLSLDDFDRHVQIIGENYFRVGNREVTLTDKNKILIKDQLDAEMKSFITIDEYGFEKETYDIFPGDKRRILRRKDGIITEDLYKPGYGWISGKRYFDTGRISLIGFEKTENSVPAKWNQSVDRSKLLQTFDENREAFIKLYPHLNDYYEKLREKLDVQISKFPTKSEIERD